MKKVIFGCFLFLFSIQTWAQEGSAKTQKNIFYMNPARFFYYTYQLGYERLLSHDNSILITGSALYKKNYSDNTFAFGNEIQYKLAVTKTSKKNGENLFYLAPYAGYMYYSVEYIYPSYYSSSYYSSNYYYPQNKYITSIAGGSLFGLNISINRFIMDLSAGGGFKFPVSNVSEKTSGFNDATFIGVYPRVNFMVGVKF